MKGFDEFITLFGDITVLQIAEFVLACVFMFFIYKQVRKYFHQKIESEHSRIEKEKLRDEQIKNALDAAHKYHELESQISELKDICVDTVARLDKMDETQNRRERNKIRETLLQNHRYYTNPQTNPSHSWTRVESETFWELYAEYEEAGGNGYMHTDVVPDMKLLTVVDVGNK